MIEMSRVNIPLGGNTEVYTDREDRKYFNYANVRKAAHRSNKEYSIQDFEQIDSILECPILETTYTWKEFDQH